MQALEIQGEWKTEGNIYNCCLHCSKTEGGKANTFIIISFLFFCSLSFASCQHLMWFGMVVLKFIAYSDLCCVHLTENILQPTKRDDPRQMQDISRQETYPSNLVFFVWFGERFSMWRIILVVQFITFKERPVSVKREIWVDSVTRLKWQTTNGPSTDRTVPVSFISFSRLFNHVRCSEMYLWEHFRGHWTFFVMSHEVVCFKRSKIGRKIA